MKQQETVKNCIDYLKSLKVNKSKQKYIQYAINFIQEHNSNNVLVYKDYICPIYYNAKDNLLFGKAINIKDINMGILIIEGTSVSEIVKCLHDDVDFIEGLAI